MWLVLGLGNPGGQYARSRHNIGFMVADRLVERDGAVCERKQLGALVERVRLGDEDAIVAKPMQFMNVSGQAAASLRGYYKLSNNDIVVVHDDLELPFGEVALKRSGGHGGHNGLRDLQQRLGGNDFHRVRVGIGRPPKGWDVADYVLANFTAAEQSTLEHIVDQAADAVVKVLADGGVVERGAGRGRGHRSNRGSSRRRAAAAPISSRVRPAHSISRRRGSAPRHLTL